jgi:hypothetical protein
LEKTIPPLMAGNPDQIEEKFTLINSTAEPMTVRCIRTSCKFSHGVWVTFPNRCYPFAFS